MKSVGILGFGRFGKVLSDLLKTDFQVKVYDKHPQAEASIDFVSLDELLNETEIFIAVPINQFEQVIQSIANRLKDNTTIFDVCSIKLHPVKIMKQYLSATTDIIATHPLFGPDSIESTEPLNFMMHPVRNNHNRYEAWKTFFAKRFNIVEMTPDEHDRYAAKSQGVVHFVSRFLNEAKLKATPIDTQGFKQILQLIEYNCNDSWELFSDLQNYNPYSEAMIQRLEEAFQAVKSKL